MNFTPVTSSNIKGITYDSVANTLYVQFKTDRVYSYVGVAPDMYDEFLASESKGKFFHANIRNTYDASEVVQDGETPIE